MGPKSTLATWEKFQSGTPVQARTQILDSWRRSRRDGVDPDHLELTHTDINDQSPFLRIGGRVMEQMADLLIGNSTSLALADSDGTVAWRWDSERSVARCLDHVDFGPGSRMNEPLAGTNGIGMATTTNRIALVVGAEHFKQPCTPGRVPQLPSWIPSPGEWWDRSTSHAAPQMLITFCSSRPAHW